MGQGMEGIWSPVRSRARLTRRTQDRARQAQGAPMCIHLLSPVLYAGPTSPWPQGPTEGSVLSI